MAMITTDPESLHHVLADAMPHIVWTQDGAGTPTYFNVKWTEYTGWDLAETLLRGWDTLVHPSDLPEVNRRWQDAAARGAPFETTYRLRGRDGGYRWHTARIVPIVHAESVASWMGTAVDVDEQRRIHDEQRFLIEASAVLGTSLDLGETLRDVSHLVVPHLADWCAIDLLNDAGLLERPAIAHVDPAKVALAWELRRLQPPRPEDSHGIYEVARSRRAELLADVPDELLVSLLTDPQILALVRDLGLRSSMCVPLVARDKALGTLTLVSSELGRRYGARDLAFAEELARRISIAVDNARLYGAMKEARTAAEAMATDILQQSREVEAALLTMRAERDSALARVEAIERALRNGGPVPP